MTLHRIAATTAVFLTLLSLAWAQEKTGQDKNNTPPPSFKRCSTAKT